MWFHSFHYCNVVVKIQNSRLEFVYYACNHQKINQDNCKKVDFKCSCTSRKLVQCNPTLIACGQFATNNLVVIDIVTKDSFSTSDSKATTWS